MTDFRDEDDMPIGMPPGGLSDVAPLSEAEVQEAAQEIYQRDLVGLTIAPVLQRIAAVAAGRERERAARAHNERVDDSVNEPPR